ncbi:hypothetical protein J7295_00522 [Nakaseomyces glabratus]|nr:hypothetical protein J7298_00521 [Nakaseomyces glabratus]KAH7607836.1 hypothetical protein J7295_00522 [Nakaseomyces glabratus]KAH7614987.1 hypothetical protein J7292_00519 [Nakaseomyces glabratus]
MRSFIKSHRKSNSLESDSDIDFKQLKRKNASTSQLSPPRYNTDYYDPVTSSPKTPTHSHTTSDSLPQKHSPGFESLHRLFNNKLFKKASNSSLNSYLANTDSQSRRSSKDQDPLAPSFHVLKTSSNPASQDSELPVIKGVITHTWGNHSKHNDPHVIVLNDPKTSFETLRSSDLEPPPRLTSKTTRSSVSSERSWSTRDHSMSPPLTSINQDIDIPEDMATRSKNTLINKKKMENRQARIHSNDDLIAMRKNSSDTLPQTAEFFASDKLPGDSTPILEIPESPPPVITLEKYNSSLSDAKELSRSKNVRSNRTSVVSMTQSEESRWSNHLMVNSNHNQNKLRDSDDSDYSNAIDEEDDDDADDDDEASQFSFEYSNLSGRTPSVKYYSKPEPKQMVYIDDLYDDEDFDEDMNYYDENEVSEFLQEEMASNKNNINTDTSVLKDLSVPSINDHSNEKPIYKPTIQMRVNKPKVHRYNDLFALSDEDDPSFNDDDEFDEDEEEGGDDNDEEDEIDEEYDQKVSDECGQSIELQSDDIHSDYGVEYYNDFGGDLNLQNDVQKHHINKEQQYISDEEFDDAITDFNMAKHIIEEEVVLDKAEALRYQKDAEPVQSKTSEDVVNYVDEDSNLRINEKLEKGDVTYQKPTLLTEVKNKQFQKKPVASFADIFNLESDSEEDINNEDGLTGLSDVGLDEDDAVSSPILQSPFESQSLAEGLVSPVICTPGKPNIINKQIIPTIKCEPSSPQEKTIENNKSHTASNFKEYGLNHPLPPPARSQALKFHDLNSELDSELPALMSNLYFIDETEEDAYNELNDVTRDEDEYLDEINTVPEDFNFSDTENDNNAAKRMLRRSNKGSFRSTYSFTDKPQGVTTESSPIKNKLEVNNKTVTFFSSPGWSKSPGSEIGMQRSKSPVKPSSGYRPFGQGSKQFPITPSHEPNYSIEEDRIASTDEILESRTPPTTYMAPSPAFIPNYSLSPIQEASSSVTNSPKR